MRLGTYKYVQWLKKKEYGSGHPVDCIKVGR